MDDLGGMTEEEQIEMAIRMSMQQDAAPQEEPMATEGKQSDFNEKFSIKTQINYFNRPHFEISSQKLVIITYKTSLPKIFKSMWLVIRLYGECEVL